MPPLSKKAFAKPTKKVCKTFKQPLLTQKNIGNIIHPVENSKKQYSSNASFTSSAEKKEKCGRKLTKRTVSMHLSFEEAQALENSDNVSPEMGMMEPDGKDAYLKFVQSFSQSSRENSICSTPLTKDSIMSKSLDDLFKSVDRSDPVLLAESAEISQQVKASLESDILSQEYLNRKEVKNAYLECVDKLDNKKFDIMKNPTDSAEISQQVKASVDSGVSLSQEYLNQKEVKHAYLECVNNLGMEKFDVIKNSSKKKTKSNSIRASSKKCKQPTEENKACKENISKDKSNCEKPNKEDKAVNKKRKLLKDVSVVKTKHVEGKTKRKPKKETLKTKLLENKDKQGESMTLYDKMTLIQESRNVGLYALCDICDKARYLPDVKDPLDLPDKWYCAMNPDEKYNKCSYPEEMDENEIEFLIDNLYNAGSIVWAKMDGYPWWPAMVEDDPDVEEYYWLEKDIPQPTWYHVTFFDSYEVTRAWLRPSCLKPFKINMTNPMFQAPKLNKFKSRIDASFKQAVDAVGLPLIDRLRKYSFIQRYSRSWKLTKDIEKKQSQSKRVPKEKNGLKSTKPKKFRRILSSNESLVKCDDNISDILNTMDWQNDANININLLE